MFVCQFLFIFKNQSIQILLCSKKLMDSFSNIFHPNYKEHSQTPEEFGDYKLEYLNEHEKSFKELEDILCTKDDDKSQQGQQAVSLSAMSEVEEDLFDLEVQLKLRRYTSFQNGFMEHHRKILKSSLQEFFKKNSNFSKFNNQDDFQCQTGDDIKSYVFNQKLFNSEQVQQHKERLLKKVDEYKILKQILQCFQKQEKNIAKDAMLMAIWILKNTDHLVSNIVHQNSFCIKQVQKTKQELLIYLENCNNIDFLKQKIAQEIQGEQQYNLMIESWIYTMLVAKLGYFDNDCFDVNLSLQEHLKSLLKEQKRQHSVFSDSEDDQIMNLEISSKKRKI